MKGVVLSGTGGVWQVRTEDGETRAASLRGRLKKADEGRRADGSLRRDTVAAAERTLKLVVGDDSFKGLASHFDERHVVDSCISRRIWPQRCHSSERGERCQQVMWSSLSETRMDRLTLRRRQRE